MKKLAMLYEGKAKKVYQTDDANLYIVDYKDDATAFDGVKKGTIESKGIINNRVSNYLMKMLERKGIPTHFVEELSERETLVKKVDIVLLEVIVRNIATGSMVKRLGIEDGTVLNPPVLEFSYKNDAYHDPLINDDHAIAMKLATAEEIAVIKDYARKINDILKAFFKEIDIDLVDFKLEFGRTADGTIILADEISPDTCRFLDVQTKKKKDKNSFRQDLDDVDAGYKEILKRLMGE